jgi:hypothetical protein
VSKILSQNETETRGPGVGFRVQTAVPPKI